MSLIIPVGKDDHVKGPEDAPVTLVEYGDYQCPGCGAAYPMVKAIQKRLGAKLRFVFRNMPLNEIHPNAEMAAEAAEAAGAQGKFWELHDALYEHQDRRRLHGLASVTRQSRQYRVATPANAILRIGTESKVSCMPKVTFIAFTGGAHTVEVPVGTTLMRAATDNRVPGIDGDCGGNCACATCHVYVDPNWSDRVGARSATEDDMLNIVAEPRGNSRLACQITLTDALNGLIVNLPEAQH